jgi:hypothetical protein
MISLEVSEFRTRVLKLMKNTAADFESAVEHIRTQWLAIAPEQRLALARGASSYSRRWLGEEGRPARGDRDDRT